MDHFQSSNVDIVDFTVSIETLDGLTLGSGILVNSIHVLTCYHVINHESVSTNGLFIRLNINNLRLEVKYNPNFVNEFEGLSRKVYEYKTNNHLLRL